MEFSMHFIVFYNRYINCIKERSIIKMSGEEVRRAFDDRYGAGGRVLAVRAPGRVNLIGEHTDYNDGFVLPMAISHGVTILGRARDDRKLRVFSIDYGEEVVADLDGRFGVCPARWCHYVEGVVRTFEEELGADLKGFDAVFAGDVPQGAGLSSSAALEVATGFFLNELYGLGVGRVDIALFGQRAENNYLGVRCGIMDQFASCLSRGGSALFLDCRSLDYELVPLNMKDEVVLILNSGRSRGLVDSKYNERRRACEEGVRFFGKWLPGVRALRDVSPEQFEEHKGRLPDEVGKRCRHIVYENRRVLESVECLKRGDLARFGELMWASHDSLRDDYEVSCGELDALNELARGLDGVVGERMTGAGFGGCAVAIVRRAAKDDVIKSISAGYKKKTGRDLVVYESGAADGAGCLAS
jgi:galactokinase